MISYYILDDQHQPQAVDLETWAAWLGNPDNRHVALDRVGEVVVSTAFIGLDPHLAHEARLFETMVFGGTLDREIRRCATWEDALKQQADLVAAVAESF